MWRQIAAFRTAMKKGKVILDDLKINLKEIF